MVNSKGLYRDALMYSVYNTLANLYKVQVPTLHEKYKAASLVYPDCSGDFAEIAYRCIQVLESCISKPAKEISSISFSKTGTPKVLLDDGSSFLMIVNIDKKPSWKVVKSTTVSKFITLINGHEGKISDALTNAENELDPLDMIAEQLNKKASPEIYTTLIKTLVPVSNFISLDIDQIDQQILATAFFYSKCGNADAKIELPCRLLETRRKNAAALRCLFDHNWIIDFRLRSPVNPGRSRIEWFLRDYPIGAICHTTEVKAQEQLIVYG